MTSGALVAGAEIAVRVIVNVRKAGGGVYLALPGALRAMWRDQDPLAAQRVIAAVRELRGGGQTRLSFQTACTRTRRAIPEYRGKRSAVCWAPLNYHRLRKP